MQDVSSKSDNGKVLKNKGGGFWEKGENSGEGRREEFREKKMQTSQMPSESESMQKISFKSDNGKVFKNRVDGFWEKGGISGVG